MLVALPVQYRELSNDLKTMIGDVIPSAAIIKNSWQGEDAEVYITHLHSLHSVVMTCAEDIEKLADLIEMQAAVQLIV